MVNAVNRVEAWRPHGGRRVCDTVTGMSYDVKAKGSCDSVEMSCGTLVGLGVWGERWRELVRRRSCVGVRHVR